MTAFFIQFFKIESYKGNEYLEYDLADYGTSGVIW